MDITSSVRTKTRLSGTRDFDPDRNRSIGHKVSKLAYVSPRDVFIPQKPSGESRRKHEI